MRAVVLAEIALPEFGAPTEQPAVPAATHAAGLAAAREKARAAGHDVIVVYADREHGGNIAYLTGFEPRFEEAMPVIGARDEPALVVGNECRGYARVSQVPVRAVLVPDDHHVGRPAPGRGHRPRDSLRRQDFDHGRADGGARRGGGRDGCRA